MRKLATCVCYLILTAIMLAAVTGFVFDFMKKYNQEVTKEMDKIIKCKDDYKKNRCDHPVPLVLHACEKLKFCGSKTASEQIKSYNIISRILMEMISDVSSGFTWQSIIVVTAAICICMCCKGLIGMRRGSDGKVEIAVGDQEKNFGGKKASEQSAAMEDRMLKMMEKVMEKSNEQQALLSEQMK